MLNARYSFCDDDLETAVRTLTRMLFNVPPPASSVIPLVRSLLVDKIYGTVALHDPDFASMQSAVHNIVSEAALSTDWAPLRQAAPAPDSVGPMAYQDYVAMLKSHDGYIAELASLGPSAQYPNRCQHTQQMLGALRTLLRSSTAQRPVRTKELDPVAMETLLLQLPLPIEVTPSSHFMLPIYNKQRVSVAATSNPVSYPASRRESVVTSLDMSSFAAQLAAAADAAAAAAATAAAELADADTEERRRREPGTVLHCLLREQQEINSAIDSARRTLQALASTARGEPYSSPALKEAADHIADDRVPSSWMPDSSSQALTTWMQTLRSRRDVVAAWLASGRPAPTWLSQGIVHRASMLRALLVDTALRSLRKPLRDTDDDNEQPEYTVADLVYQADLDGRSHDGMAITTLPVEGLWLAGAAWDGSIGRLRDLRPTEAAAPAPRIYLSIVPAETASLPDGAMQVPVLEHRTRFAADGSPDAPLFCVWVAAGSSVEQWRGRNLALLCEEPAEVACDALHDV